MSMQIFRAVVTATRALSPGMVRITLGGEGMAAFTSTGVGDEYLRVFLPHPGENEPVLPFPVGDDSWDYPEGVAGAPMRTYTVRAAREGEIDIDFVVHEGGIAAEWAMRAKPGDAVGLNSPRDLYSPPDGLEWRLLIADATGLPAIARLLEDASAGVRTRAIIEVADEGHRIELAAAAGTDVHWVYGGNGHGASRLAEIVRDQELPGGVGYVWVAGETAAMRGARSHLRRTLGLPASAYKIIGYWTDSAERWEERYAGLDQDTKDRLAAIWDQDKDGEELIDEYEDALETLGL